MHFLRWALIAGTDKPLAERIQRAFFLLTMLLVLVSGAASLVLYLLEVPAQEQEEHTQTLRLIGGRMGSDIGDTLRKLDDLSRSSLVWTALTDSSGREAYLKPFLASQDKKSSHDDLFLLDYKGRPMAGQLPPDIPAERLQDTVAAVLKDRRPQFVIHTEPLRFLAAYPVLFPYSQDAIGVLAGTVDLGGQFRNDVASLDHGHGIRLLRGDEVLDQLPLQAADRFFPARFRIPLPDTENMPLLQLEMYSTDRAWLTPILIRIALSLTIGLAFGLLVWRIAGKVATSLTRRLNRLAIACAGVAAGQPFGVEDQAEDEIGLLTRTLRQAIQAHEEIEQHLEQLVRHKTEALHESLERYRQAFEINTAIKLIVAPDDGRIVDANEAACHFYGYSRAQLLALRMQDINILSEAEIQAEMQRAAAEGQAYFNFRHRLASGEIRDVEVYTGPLTLGGKHYLHSIIHDITERRAAEAQLRLAASVFRQSHEGILLTDGKAHIVDVNEAFTRITGYGREEALGRSPSLLKSGRQEPEFYAQLWATLKETGFWQGELWNRRKDGGIYPELLTISAVRDTGGKISHYVGVFADISTIKHHEQQLERIAHYDALTQLPNRLLLADRMGLALAQARRSGTLVGICYLDLDGFKAINDEHGHAAGDKLLVEVADRLGKSLRAGDTVARLGGDEFVLVMVGLKSAEECVEVLQRVIRTVNEPVAFDDGATASVSASIGVALFPETDEEADVLLRQADIAMYEAKQAGKNRYQIFNPEQDRRVRNYRARQRELELAMARDEFVIHYQPKVNLRSRTVVGMEALLRWQHPSRGLLLPGAFLTNLNNPERESGIDRWVLHAVARQIDSWQSQGLHLPVSVNISAPHLESADFVAQIRELLVAHPGIAGLLELEMLESAALEDVDRVADIIRECRDMGVPFALDDFGTGYSSLTYFRRLPADILKIDISFVQNMLKNPDDRAIVQAIIGLTQAFGRQAIAEGVETLAHGRALLDLGCEIVQGFGIARPMPAAEVPAWIAAWRHDPVWHFPHDPAPGPDLPRGSPDSGGAQPLAAMDRL